MKVLERFGLKGRCALVTGAGMGLGRAMARALAEAGCDIVAADVNLENAQSAAAEFRALGVRALATRTDVTKEDEAEACVKAALAEFGKIDVLLNNAGIVRHYPAEEMSLKDWNDVIGVNLTGVFIMAKAVGRTMLERGRGSIVNISSMSGQIVNTPQCQCSYNASKAGVILLTKSLAAEWAPRGVRVNTIAPGYMQTELNKKFLEEPANKPLVDKWLAMTPQARVGLPEELGGIAVYLASDASSYATGGVFTIDGGYTAW